MNLSLVLGLIFSTMSFAHTLKSFGDAKAILRDQVYKGFERTFYCDCEYQKQSIKENCQLYHQKNTKRAKRLEWEHVVPAHAFGQSFKEWREHKTLCKGKKIIGGRKCARKLSPEFRVMEADPHNLVPSIGSVNALRSNFSFRDLDKSDFKVCQTDFKIQGNKVMPPLNKRGDVARIYLYMESKYPGRGIISNQNQKLFQAWDLADPVDKLECEIYQRKLLIGADKSEIHAKACELLKAKK